MITFSSRYLLYLPIPLSLLLSLPLSLSLSLPPSLLLPPCLPPSLPPSLSLSLPLSLPHPLSLLSAVWSSYNPIMSQTIFSITLYTLVVLFFILAVLWILCVVISPLLDDDCMIPVYEDDEPPSQPPQPACEADKFIGRVCLSVFQALLIVGVAKIVSVVYMIPFVTSTTAFFTLPFLIVLYGIFSVCLIGPIITLIRSLVCCCVRPSSTLPALCCFSKLIDV